MDGHLGDGREMTAEGVAQTYIGKGKGKVANFGVFGGPVPTRDVQRVGRGQAYPASADRMASSSSSSIRRVISCSDWFITV
jgi:hypothetical protein